MDWYWIGLICTICLVITTHWLIKDEESQIGEPPTY